MEKAIIYIIGVLVFSAIWCFIVLSFDRKKVCEDKHKNYYKPIDKNGLSKDMLEIERKTNLIVKDYPTLNKDKIKRGLYNEHFMKKYSNKGEENEI